MRRAMMVAAWLSCASTSTWAMSGADLQELCKEPGRKDDLMFCFGYISGVIDKALFDKAIKAGAPPKVSNPPTPVEMKLLELHEMSLQIHCGGEGVSRQQLIAVVQKHLREHPERWHLPAPHLVIHAVWTAFPCM